MEGGKIDTRENRKNEVGAAETGVKRCGELSKTEYRLISLPPVGGKSKRAKLWEGRTSPRVPR